MRALKYLLWAVLAVVAAFAGLAVVAAIVVVGAVVLLVRLIRRQWLGRRPVHPRTPAAAPAGPPGMGGPVIEVTATEVRDER